MTVYDEVKKHLRIFKKSGNEWPTIDYLLEKIPKRSRPNIWTALNELSKKAGDPELKKLAFRAGNLTEEDKIFLFGMQDGKTAFSALVKYAKSHNVEPYHSAGIIIGKLKGFSRRDAGIRKTLTDAGVLKNSPLYEKLKTILQGCIQKEDEWPTLNFISGKFPRGNRTDIKKNLKKMRADENEDPKLRKLAFRARNLREVDKMVLLGMERGIGTINGLAACAKSAKTKKTFKLRKILDRLKELSGKDKGIKKILNTWKKLQK